MKRLSILVFSLVLIGGGCVFQPPAPIAKPAAEESKFIYIDGSYELQIADSLILWEASKVQATHNGTINLKEGTIKIENGDEGEGSVVVDMTTLNNLDLDEASQKKIETHLSSKDFFDVATYPTAVFTLKRLESIQGLEGSNYRVDGTLTIKGIEKELSFPAKITEMEGGLKLTGRTAVNRTDYDIRYGSGKFFQNLGDNLIADEFFLDLNLVFVAK